MEYELRIKPRIRTLTLRHTYKAGCPAFVHAVEGRATIIHREFEFANAAGDSHVGSSLSHCQCHRVVGRVAACMQRQSHVESTAGVLDHAHLHEHRVSNLQSTDLLSLNS